MDSFKIRELIEQRRDGDKSHSYELYRLYEDCSSSLKYDLLIEALLNNYCLDDKDAISELESFFVLYTTEYSLWRLYLSSKRKQQNFNNDYVLYKKHMLNKIPQLNIHGKKIFNVDKKIEKNFNKVKNINKIEKKIKFLKKNIEKYNHPLFYKELGYIYLKENATTKEGTAFCISFSFKYI